MFFVYSQQAFQSYIVNVYMVMMTIVVVVVVVIITSVRHLSPLQHTRQWPLRQQEPDTMRQLS